MRQAWRITKQKTSLDSVHGEGAARTGGRWNTRGLAVVYASGTKSLAALENLVHLNPVVHFSYAAIRIEFDEALVERLSAESLPSDWTAEPPPPSTQRIGDLWDSDTAFGHSGGAKRDYCRGT